LAEAAPPSFVLGSQLAHIHKGLSKNQFRLKFGLQGVARKKENGMAKKYFGSLRIQRPINMIN
jgi:fructosamine-3-kinase